MQIAIQQVGKKYDKRWIFKGIDLFLQEGNSLAICGPNGSGKSTLLKIIGNYHSPTKGKVVYTSNKKILDEFDAVSKISYVGPDQNILEELTLREHVSFHFKFKKATKPTSEMLALAGLNGHEDQFVYNFSSGMRQRLKLLMAVYNDSPVLLLDEPTAYFDKKGKEWYRSTMEELKKKKTIVIASNDPEEYFFVDNQLDLQA